MGKARGGTSGAVPAVTLLLVLLSACGGEAPMPPPAGPAPISTLAYVVTQCREGPGSFSGSQTLWVRRGERPPVKIAEFPLGQPPFGGFCRSFGRLRTGQNTVVVGVLTRLAVSPDGASVFFEVTDDFSVFAPVLRAEDEGLFVVRSDGTGLRRITDHTRGGAFVVDWGCVLAGKSTCGQAMGIPEFSPNGRWVTYVDLGPGQTGEEALQVVALNVATGERQQVTRLPPLPTCEDQAQPSADCVDRIVSPVALPSFLDDRTIAYLRGKGGSIFGGGLYTVRRHTDGTWADPERVPEAGLGGGLFIPLYQITGAEPSATTNGVPGVPHNGPGPFGDIVREAFVIEPPRVPSETPRVLQLTNFGRSDTGGTRMALDRAHVIFNASADPLGTNPAFECQFFSIDRLGRDLRQLTFFGGDHGEGCGCKPGCAAPRCTMTEDGNIDRVTGSRAFASTCDPFGTNPGGGDQIFAIRTDGSGLCQLTETRGMVKHVDGTIEVEMPGPHAVPHRFR